MRVLIATTFVPFGPSGLDRIAEHLAPAIRDLGHDVDHVRLPFSRGCDSLTDRMLALRCLDLTDSAGNRVDRLVALGFPAYAVAHPAKSVWLFRYSESSCIPFGESVEEDAPHSWESSSMRKRINESDRLLLGECRRVVVATQALGGYVKRNVGLPSEVAYVPPLRSTVVDPPSTGQGDYFVCPIADLSDGRQQLVRQAMTRATGSYSVRFVIEGRSQYGGINPPKLGARVQLGEALDEGELETLVRGSCGLVYVPESQSHWPESLQYSLNARKPIVVASDSGAACELIRDGETGLVVEPIAPALADALNGLARDTARASKYGSAAFVALTSMAGSWRRVAQLLTA